MKMKTIPIVAALITALLSISYVTEANAWYEDHRPTAREAKKLKKKGMMPAKMTCSNTSSGGKMLKPKVSFSEKVNNENREWFALAYYDNMVWIPGEPNKKTGLSKKYSKLLTAKNSGRKFHCSLWIGPKGSLGKLKIRGRWAKSQGSMVNTR